ncbi:MAG: DUF4251 domain-containing protein [Chlorobi bacterium]|nr:DUF4251 domain-containing protein [Chlorobiota bacterium]
MKLPVILLIFILAFSGAFQTAIAQDTVLTKKEQKKLEKEQAREKKEAEQAVHKETIAKLLAKKFFVFKASRLYGPQGQSYSVSSAINFFAVIDSLVIVQISAEQLIGLNGVGGVTFEGITYRYVFEKNEDSKKPMIVKSRVKRVEGSPYFTISVMDNGQADLNLVLTHGGTIRMSGEIVDPREAGIFKGLTTTRL